MVQQGPQAGLYALRCIRCGSNLELPHDPRLFHIDCPYCNTDNVLPQHLIEARQRHHAIELEHQNRARLQAERVAATKRSSRVVLIVFAVMGFGLISMIGTCLAIGIVAANADEETKRRAADPKLNGSEVMLARMAKMRAESGCDRIIVQPKQHLKEEGRISLAMVANNNCVHVMGATGSGAALSMRYDGSEALSQPMPAPGPFVDYRMCAKEDGSYGFVVATPEEPFTVAALECPRTPAEGGARSKANDPLTTGKTRVSKAFGALGFQGCTTISEPTVYQGPKSFTLTSPENANCYNLVIASHFRDVTFDVSLTDPDDKALPVPSPAQEMQVSYCAKKAGKYKLSVTPSTLDHYSMADVNCPRAAKARKPAR